MSKAKLGKAYITQMYPNDFDIYGFVLDGQAKPGKVVRDKHTGVVGKVSRRGNCVLVSGTRYEIGGRNGKRRIAPSP